MVDLSHGSFFIDDDYVAEARLITPEGISENLGAHDNNVQVSVDVATDTVTLVACDSAFKIALAKAIEAARNGEKLEIDVGGTVVVVTGSPIPSINHFSMIDSDCGPAELYEDKPRFKKPFKMRDRKTTAMLAKRRFR